MNILFVVAIIFGITALLSFLNERFLGLQKTIGLMSLALGFTVFLILLEVSGVTDAFEVERSLVSQIALNETLLNGVLCFMLFAGSINVPVRTLRQQRWVILSLAIGATLVATILIGASVWVALTTLGIGLSLVYAIIFGALISPTDPIAALAILGKVGLPDDLQTVINGESLFNDGVGVVLFTIAVTVAAGAAQPDVSDAIELFFREVFGAVALGLAAAAVMHIAFSRTVDGGTQVLISLAATSLTYTLAERIEVSGPIATVILGLIVGNVTMRSQQEQDYLPFKVFWRAVDDVLNAVLFVLIGMHLAIVHTPPHALIVATTAIAVCLAARWLSVFLPLALLARFKVLHADVRKLTSLLTWGGLRGGLAIAMVLSLPDGEEKNLLLYMTYGVVAFSIVVQGSTVSRLFSGNELAKLLR